MALMGIIVLFNTATIITPSEHSFLDSSVMDAVENAGVLQPFPEGPKSEFYNQDNDGTWWVMDLLGLE